MTNPSIKRTRTKETQFERGFLDACVLAALAREDSYGYQIIKDVLSTLELSESTLYPILKRLKTQGMLEEYTREHNGRLRKFYTITDKGRAALQDFVQEESGMDEEAAVYDLGSVDAVATSVLESMPTIQRSFCNLRQNHERTALVTGLLVLGVTSGNWVAGAMDGGVSLALGGAAVLLTPIAIQVTSILYQASIRFGRWVALFFVRVAKGDEAGSPSAEPLSFWWSRHPDTFQVFMVVGAIIC